MNADGTGQRNLTHSPEYEAGPLFSSDGTHIAFYGDRDGTANVWTMKVDGSDQVNLTQDPAWVSDFDWDGTRVVFVSGRDGTRDVYVMNVDGSGRTRLTDGSGHPGIAVLSPDGQHVAFDDAVGEGSPSDLYLVNTDGSARHRLTDDPGDEDWPVWSPDRTRLAFARSDPTAAS